MRNRLKQMLSALKWNLYTLGHMIVVPRDKKVVLFGAWMGVKFADNSRYLFQYLHYNKDKLGIRKVIWITRNPEVNTMLSEMGYDSFLVGTPESKYWHLKAGTHVVCNAVNDIPNFHADIDTKFSFGTKKIQLWHGVGGIKAVGGASNLAKKNTSKDTIFKKIMRTHFLENVFSQGGWREAYVLSSGEECAKALIAYIGCREDRIFISGYPRNCTCIKLLKNEIALIERISQYNHSVLYLPTFRSDNSHYIHPLSDEKLRDFIEKNNILWIEKPHTADINQDALADENRNVCNLDSDFDINTIYTHISCVITDYSSVAFDAVYHNKPLIMYAPDIEDFRHGDVGFIIDFESYFKETLCENLTDMLELLKETTESERDYVLRRKDSYERINQYGFDNKRIDYEEIWSDIKNLH